MNNNKFKLNLVVAVMVAAFSNASFGATVDGCDTGSGGVYDGQAEYDGDGLATGNTYSVTINGGTCDVSVVDAAGGSVSSATGVTTPVETPEVVTNVAAGAVTQSSTDAINGSQLWETNQAVDANTTAITDLDGRVTQNETAIGTIQTDLNELVQYDEGGLATTLNSNDGVGTLITNVAVGAVAEGSLDAINGSQLWETNQTVDANTTAITDLDGRVTQNETAIGTIQTDLNELVQYDEGGLATTLNSNDGVGTLITNVAVGAVAEGSLDAVNGGQLYDTNLTAAEALAVAQSAMNQAGAAQMAAEGGAQYDETGTSMALNANDGVGTLLTNVADGGIFEGSLDAVNGRQLYDTNQAVAANGAAIGQNTAAIDENRGLIGQNAAAIDANRGLIGQNTAAIDENRGLIGKAQSTADEALAVGQQALTNAGKAQSTADEALALGLNSAQYDDKGNLVMRVDDNGNPMGGIKNVAAGVAATDAVNLKQMRGADVATLQSANQFTRESNQRLKSYVDERDAWTLREANQYASNGIASAMAMPTVAIQAGKTSGVALGTATYGGSYAVAGGYARVFEHGDVSGHLNVGMSLSDDQDVGAKAAYSWSW